jgi:hypothetical protein
MAYCPHSLPEALTRGEWLRALSDFREYWRSPHPRERRLRKRNQLPALATLSFKSAPNSEKQTVCTNCRVEDASEEGLAVRTALKIVPGTPLSIEVVVGDRRFILTGRVTHSTGFPGSVRVGVSLEFAGTTNDKERPSGGAMRPDEYSNK